MARALCFLLLVVCAQCQVYDFCTVGVPKADFAEDEGVPSIEVILAVAPLFSTNPKIGSSLGQLGLYHTAIILAQGSGTSRHYWTLEFDSTKGSIIHGAVPTIRGEQLSWDNDARYCLTDGLLWGRGHWKKEFDHVATITKQQAQRVFNELVLPINSSTHGGFPQYQLWRVVRTPGLRLPKGAEGSLRQHFLNINTLVGDVTCADGINWVLHFITKDLGVPLRQGFQYRGTTVWANADHIEAVDTSNPEVWQDVLAYFKRQGHLVSGPSFLGELVSLPGIFPIKYIYSANKNMYYRLHGNMPPFLHVEYAPSLLVAPPMLASWTPEPVEAHEAREATAPEQVRAEAAEAPALLQAGEADAPWPGRAGEAESSEQLQLDEADAPGSSQAQEAELPELVQADLPKWKKLNLSPEEKMARARTWNWQKKAWHANSGKGKKILHHKDAVGRAKKRFPPKPAEKMAGH